ncbi:MAG: hypothetical protein JO316_09035 [Abitibacteriaceae bacterium]|nr:hypothetical protein [Abditibacteriaceae bacterium]
MPAVRDVQQQYEKALELLVEKVQQDPYILAAILLGSLSYDVVWEKSDIDITLVTQEVKQAQTAFSLVECGINIHAIVVPRSQFKKMMAGSVQSSFMHSLMSKGKLLFTRDETIGELFETRDHLGARDQEIQLLRASTWVLPSLTKAEKWFHAKQDVNYSFLWIMKTIEGLATIEVLQHGEVTSREVIQQALRHNPQFFTAIYSDLINGKKTPRVINAALDLINNYLQARTALLFKPLLDYLAESHGIRSATELNHYFTNQMNISGVDLACEWLADQDVIQKVSAPVRLTNKSRVDVEEAAYYYAGESF